MNIQSEKNYKFFKFLKGNRPLVPGKVKKLVDSVSAGLNLFKYCPIMINEDNYVIDGQHRLEACKRLGLPVFYVVVPKITLIQIAQLNSNATRWKASDFFNCFIQTGTKDYEVLQRFQEKYNLSLNIACALLMNGSSPTGGNASAAFKEGKFRVLHYEKAEKIMKAVNDYSPVANDDILKNRAFIRAIELLTTSAEYGHRDVLAKLVVRKTPIVQKSNYKEYIVHIEELYNRGNSLRKIIYSTPKKAGGGAS